MEINELKRIRDDSPQAGTLLAYTRNRVIYESYDSREEVIRRLEGEQLLEIHLFDAEKEYRAVETRGKRRLSETGIIEYKADFPASDEEVFSDTCKLIEGGTLTLLNHLRYDEKNGMARIDDVRMIAE